MKILTIQIENYKKLKTFYQELNGKNMSVAGKTAVGKTTAISALWEIINTVGEPLTKGEKKGFVRIALDAGNGKKIFAKREFTSKTDLPIILTSDGEKLTMKEFKSWFSSLGINPQEIMEQKPKELLKTLLDATVQPKGFDLEETEKQIKDAETQRTVAYQIYNNAKKQLPKAVEKTEFVDTTEIEAKIKNASVIFNEKERLKFEINSCKDNIEKNKYHLTELYTELEKIKQKIKREEQEIENREKQLKEKEIEATKIFVPDVAELESQLSAKLFQNKKAEIYQNWLSKNDEVAKLERGYLEASEKIKELKTTLKQVLEQSKFPLPELSIDNGNIYYDNILVENLGESKRSLVSAALAAEVIDKENKLRVVRMDGVESMSSEDFEQLQKIFNDKNIQVLSSRVLRNESEAEEYEIIITGDEIIQTEND